MNVCPINFNWKQIVEPYVIQVEPSYGEIGRLQLLKLNISSKFMFTLAPKSYALMEVLISSPVPVVINDQIGCVIGDQTIFLQVEANVKVIFSLRSIKTES